MIQNLKELKLIHYFFSMIKKLDDDIELVFRSIIKRECNMYISFTFNQYNFVIYKSFKLLAAVSRSISGFNAYIHY